MRILDLHLENIGPFLESDLVFLERNIEQNNIIPTTIITGENGTGKTIILDAIRTLFLGELDKIERNIIRKNNNYSNILFLNDNLKETKLVSYENDIENVFDSYLSKRFSKPELLKKDWNWVIDYWTSKLSTDSFEIKNFVAPNYNELYVNSLSGIHQNIETTQLICFFDYLRTSENPNEKIVGEKLYEILKKIFKISLNDGELKYVTRSTLQPIVTQAGQEVTLDKLSSGNLYMIQRMISMLGKMYSVHLINNNPIDELCKTPGVLLIDEAENHLHPKWQKVFINSIKEIFPNLQIILTTHSPFIVASVENARIYVCETNGDHAVVKDETKTYSNKSIEEILTSPLFGETYPFNQEISILLQQRKIAVSQKNKDERIKIEKRLQKINPQYFSYFEIDELLTEIL